MSFLVQHVIWALVPKIKLILGLFARIKPTAQSLMGRPRYTPTTQYPARLLGRIKYETKPATKGNPKAPLYIYIFLIEGGSYI